MALGLLAVCSLTLVGSAILLVDTNLGFLFWLGSVLDRAGYTAFPARSVPDAVELLRELHLKVALLLLNCSLSGAADFIESTRGAQRRLKVIGLVEEEQTPVTAGVDAVWSRPVEINKETEEQLLKIVHQMLQRSMNA